MLIYIFYKIDQIFQKKNDLQQKIYILYFENEEYIIGL